MYIQFDMILPMVKMSEAIDGDKVVVKITDWSQGSPSGEVVHVLGASGSHELEMQSIVNKLYAFLKDNTALYEKILHIFNAQTSDGNDKILEMLSQHSLLIPEIEVTGGLKEQRCSYATTVIPSFYDCVLKDQKKYSVLIDRLLSFSQRLLGTDYSIAYDPNHKINPFKPSIKLIIEL